MLPDPSAQLISELRRLGNRELRVTLGALTSREREQVLGLLETAERPAVPPSFGTLAGLSPWLLKAVDRAKSDDGRPRLTPDSRAALLRALGGLEATNEEGSARTTRGGATFFGRMLANLSKRRVTS